MQHATRQTRSGWRHAGRNALAALAASAVLSVALSGVLATPASASGSWDFNHGIVDRIYRAELGRWAGADANGWVSAIQNGQMSASDVAHAVAWSDEGVRKTVTDAYHTWLRRDPDPGGLTAWSAWLRQGHTFEQLTASFLASDEYYSKQGSNSASFVQSLYTGVLGRPAESGGLAGWVAAVRGSGRYNVAYAILTSLEARTAQVRLIFSWIFDRAPSTAELNAWVAWLRGGGSFKDGAAWALGQPEAQNLGSNVPLGPIQPGNLDNAPRFTYVEGYWGTGYVYDLDIHQYLHRDDSYFKVTDWGEYLYSTDGGYSGIDVHTGQYVSAGSHQDHGAVAQGAAEGALLCHEAGGGEVAVPVCGAIGAIISFF